MATVSQAWWVMPPTAQASFLSISGCASGSSQRLIDSASSGCIHLPPPRVQAPRRTTCGWRSQASVNAGSTRASALISLKLSSQIAQWVSMSDMAEPFPKNTQYVVFSSSGAR